MHDREKRRPQTQKEKFEMKRLTVRLFPIHRHTRVSAERREDDLPPPRALTLTLVSITEPVRMRRVQTWT